ncbi:hypothetical protein CEXT_615131 [Caerostris extrusa]|uniref:Uncharacterized protein n=1 Tax=Caerostris extrusa TaxID=172846 RepID=A0AAV4PN64_CAEEX|nr:hypothetical protein CEXT_615131 [Caerostris extrusa]
MNFTKKKTSALLHAHKKSDIDLCKYALSIPVVSELLMTPFSDYRKTGMVLSSHYLGKVKRVSAENEMAWTRPEVMRNEAMKNDAKGF